MKRSRVCTKGRGVFALKLSGDRLGGDLEGFWSGAPKEVCLDRERRAGDRISLRLPLSACKLPRPEERPDRIVLLMHLLREVALQPCDCELFMNGCRLSLMTAKGREGMKPCPSPCAAPWTRKEPQLECHRKRCGCGLDETAGRSQVCVEFAGSAWEQASGCLVAEAANPEPPHRIL